MVAIESYKFEEWTIYKATALLHQLVDVTYHLRDDVLGIFAKTLNLSRQDLLEKLYGNPEELKRIHEIARLLFSACVFALASQFYALAQKDKKLSDHEYLVTGLFHGSPIESSHQTFSSIANLSFANYQSQLSKVSASNMIEIELEAIKLNIIRSSGMSSG